MLFLRLGILSMTLAAACPAWGQAAASFNSGGGRRSGDGIQVTDGAGMLAAGESAGDGVRVTAGFVTSHPTITPVVLRTFHLTLESEGVVLTWEGDDDTRSYGFRLLRARMPIGSSTAPDDAYEQVDRPFPDYGPHRYVDQDVVKGYVYFYRLKWFLGSGEVLALGPWSIEITESPGLQQVVMYPAQPNPFREGMAVSFDMPEPARVGWRLHDVRGRSVAAGSLGLLPAGHHSYKVETLVPLAQGVYFIRMRVGEESFVQKVVRLP